MAITKLPDLPKEFFCEVSQGNIPGVSQMNKFGRNDTVATAGEDIWDGGGAYSFLTGAEKIELTSSGATDTSAGSGAQTVVIIGLNSAYASASETLSTNGGTAVTSSNTYLRVFRAYVATAGDVGANVGRLTLTAASTATTVAQVATANNQTLMAIYTIPAGKTGCLVQVYASVNKRTSAIADIKLWVRPENGVFQLKHVEAVAQSGSSILTHVFMPYKMYAAKTDIKISAVPSAADSDISAGFDIILVDE